MSHRAALYTVTVKKAYARANRKLGDIDEVGAGLGDELERCLGNFPEPMEGAERSARVLAVELDGEEIRVLLQHGETGLAADIVNDAGDHQYRQVLTEAGGEGRAVV